MIRTTASSPPPSLLLCLALCLASGLGFIAPVAGQTADQSAGPTADPTSGPSAQDPAQQRIAATPETSGEEGSVPLFLDTLDVELVDFEVVVTDRKGEPVAGLTADDFEVLEDGEPVEVTHFLAVDGGQAVAPAPPAGGAADKTPTAPQLHLAVLVENLPPQGRKPVFDTLREETAGLQERGDQVMVAAIDAGLRIEQPFTDDPSLVAGALDRLARNAGGAMISIERRRVLTALLAARPPIGESPDPFDSSDTTGSRDEAERLLRSIHTVAAQISARNRRSLDSMRALVDSMAGLAGRKVVLLLTGGLEPFPAEDLFAAWEGKYAQVFGPALGFISPQSEARQHEVTSELRELERHANASRVAIYGLGVGEDLAARLLSAEAGGRISTEPLMVQDRDAMAVAASFAEATGGRAASGGRNADELLATMVRDLSSYYSLGFHRNQPQPDEQHTLEVRVRDPELRVHHRRAYRAKSGAETAEDRTLAALIHDVTDNPLGIRLEIGTPEKQKRDRFLVPVLIRIPLGRVVLIPHGQTHTGALTVVVAVRDSEGRLSSPQRLEVPVEVANDRLLAAMVQDLGYQITLEMRAGEQKLAVGVADRLAATTSTLNLNIPVG